MSWGWRHGIVSSVDGLKLKGVLLKIHLLNLLMKVQVEGGFRIEFEYTVSGFSRPFITQCSIWKFHHRKGNRSLKPAVDKCLPPSSSSPLDTIQIPEEDIGEPEMEKKDCSQQNAAVKVTVEDRAGDERDGLLWHRFSITRKGLLDRASCRRSAAVTWVPLFRNRLEPAVLLTSSTSPRILHLNTRRPGSYETIRKREVGLEWRMHLWRTWRDVSGASVELGCISYLGFNHYETLGM